jgi:hypothetical protein
MTSIPNDGSDDDNSSKEDKESKDDRKFEPHALKMTYTQ